MREQRKPSYVQHRGMRWGVVSWLCLGAAGCGGVAGPDVASVEPSSSASAGLVERVRDSAELAKMQDYVDSLYDAKAVVHRFTSKGGDDIDCVPLYAQPALRQPGMENHRIQLAPGTEPVSPERLVASPTAPDAKWRAQPATLDGMETSPDDLDATGALRRCPQGSVPIVRLTLDTLKRFESLDDFR